MNSKLFWEWVEKFEKLRSYKESLNKGGIINEEEYYRYENEFLAFYKMVYNDLMTMMIGVIDKQTENKDANFTFAEILSKL